MTPSDEHWFDHEKLEVYREAIAFVAWLSTVLENAVRVGDVKDQLDRASTSVPLNIAEGNGKYAPRTVVASSTLPMAPPWNAPPRWTLMPKGKLTVEQIRPGKEILQRVVRMLMGLIKRNSTRNYDKNEPAE